MIIMSVGGFILFSIFILIANNENKYNDYL